MRALFSCIPSEGHFRPLLPLARALAGAGHDVAFATAADWHPRVADGPDELTADAVRAALRRVLDEPSFGAAARALQAEIAAMPAPEEAARAVEEYVSRG